MSAFLSFIVGETVQLKSKIYFTLEDEGEIGTSLFRNITENQDNLRISKMINITREEGLQLIDNRSLTAWIIIPWKRTVAGLSATWAICR